MVFRSSFVGVALIFFAALVVGCKSESGSKRQFLSLGTAPPGGAFPVVGGAIAEVLNGNKGSIDWKVQIKGTKGSQENIRLLKQGVLELALSNAAISYFAARGEASWDEKYEIRAIATMAPNVAMFIARADSGIQSIADLKDRRVITGPAGAGFRMFIEPILVEHGLEWDDIKALNASQGDAVDQLADGSADAAFLGGAIPAPAIERAARTFDIQFIPFEATTRQKLIDNYPFFHGITIPSEKYVGLEEDFQGLNVGSMHVITWESQSDELIYELTKAIWENREEIASTHPAGKALNEKNITRDTGIEYHPGAVRFYQEIGLMEGGTNAEIEAETPPQDQEATSDQPAESKE